VRAWIGAGGEATRWAEHPIYIIQYNVRACLTMICEVCKIRQATIHEMSTDSTNPATEPYLKPFCSACFESSKGFNVLGPNEDWGDDISEET